MVEQLGQAINDGKSKAEPGAPVAVWFAEPIELAEYFPALVLRNSRARIPHLDVQLSAAFPATHEQPSMRGVAHRIGYQIEQDALEQDEVAAHPGGGAGYSQRQSLFLHRPGERALDLRQQLRHRKL